jgi:hypothetical protein
MRILHAFRAKRLLWCLGLLGMLAWSSGCDSGAPIADIEASKGGERGAAEKDARSKAFGTTGTPKTEKPGSTK